MIGEMDDTDAGKVLGSLGWRIGETNALYDVNGCALRSQVVNLRPAEARDRGERVHDLLLLGPGDIIWQRLRSALDITGRESKDHISKPLYDID